MTKRIHVEVDDQMAFALEHYAKKHNISRQKATRILLHRQLFQKDAPDAVTLMSERLNELQKAINTLIQAFNDERLTDTRLINLLLLGLNEEGDDPDRSQSD